MHGTRNGFVTATVLSRRFPSTHLSAGANPSLVSLTAAPLTSGGSSAPWVCRGWFLHRVVDGSTPTIGKSSMGFLDPGARFPLPTCHVNRIHLL